jgi:glycosyltransferase involved in cell wall biosynthesis
VAGPTEAGEIEGLRLHGAEARGRVEHLGFVGPEALAELYRDCVAVVLPSLYEGFGLPLLEAFVAGAPVVASDIPTVREIAGAGALYVSRPLDPECWRRALHEICADGPLRERLRAAGSAAAETYTWDAVAHHFADLVVATAGANARASRTADAPTSTGASAGGG